MTERQTVLLTLTQNEALLDAVKKTAVSQNHTTLNIGDETAVGAARIVAQQENLGEKLSGQTGRLFEKVAAWQPALLIFDVTNDAIPWQRWIPTLKSSPATRRFPILSVGETDEQLAEAKRVGSNYTAVLATFLQEHNALIQKIARIPDYDALAASCAEPLPALAVEGLALFNQGEFYKCHDALEEAWRADKSAARNLYKGVLQVGIAYFQIERGNYRGAVKMLLRVRQWLDPLPDTCRGVDIASLREDVTAVQTALTTLGPNEINSFDRSLFKPVHYQQT